MKLGAQKRLAGNVMKCSPKRVKFDKERLEEIKESITKADIKSLIKDNAISKVKEKGVSRVRARKRKIQKSKGRRRGPGSRKGKKTARLPRKEQWMNRVRKQREFIKELKDKKQLDVTIYRILYRKIKGGFFRSKRHVKLYLTENSLVRKK